MGASDYYTESISPTARMRTQTNAPPITNLLLALRKASAPFVVPTLFVIVALLLANGIV